MAAVRHVLDMVDRADVPVKGVLCFTNADLPWLRTAKMRGHLLMYGRGLAKKLDSDGALAAETIKPIARSLAAALPSA